VLVFTFLLVYPYQLLWYRACIDAYLGCRVARIIVGPILLWHVHLPNLHVWKTCQKHQLFCLTQLGMWISNEKRLSILSVYKLLFWIKRRLFTFIIHTVFLICWCDHLGSLFLKHKPQKETPKNIWSVRKIDRFGPDFWKQDQVYSASWFETVKINQLIENIND
jgi:hypothetical protein